MGKLRNVIINNNLRVNRIISNNRVALMVWMILVKLYDCSHGNVVKNEILEALSKNKVICNSRKEKKKLINKIWLDREVYLIDPNEFFLFQFQNSSSSHKKEYVGNREKELLCGKINRNGAWKVFTDKWLAYQRFKEFYGRNVVLICNINEKKRFIDFIEKNNIAIIKSTLESRGRGIVVVKKESMETAWEYVGNLIKNGEKVILEQWVAQAKELSVFHPCSVNTLRFATFRINEKVFLLFAALRTGRAGSFVDNGGAGGIFASINIENGIIDSDGYDKLGNHYVEHPDTNIKFKGFQMPEWKQVCELVRKLSGIVPEQKYVGWDLAYTNNGWIMIEGNSFGQMGIPQISTQKGLRETVNNTFYKVINGGEH